MLDKTYPVERLLGWQPGGKPGGSPKRACGVDRIHNCRRAAAAGLGGGAPDGSRCHLYLPADRLPEWTTGRKPGPEEQIASTADVLLAM